MKLRKCQAVWLSKVAVKFILKKKDLTYLVYIILSKQVKKKTTAKKGLDTLIPSKMSAACLSILVMVIKYLNVLVKTCPLFN